MFLQAAWLTEAVSHWLVDSMLPHDPYKVLTMGLTYSKYSLTEAAALWISAMVEADDLAPVIYLVAQVPDTSFEEQTGVLTAMTQLLTLSQARFLFTLPPSSPLPLRIHPDFGPDRCEGTGVYYS